MFARSTTEDAHTAEAASPEVKSHALVVVDASLSAIPGIELPTAVYVSVAAAFGLMFAFAWLFFESGRETDFTLSMAGALITVFFALPLLIYVTARHHLAANTRRVGEFLASDVDTATGPLRGSQAWLEILLIPAALAIAAGLIGAVHAIVG
jgi:hypothetical protein